MKHLIRSTNLGLQRKQLTVECSRVHADKHCVT